VRCSLCPHRCAIKPGAAGLCRVRRNRGGAMALPFYGLLSATALDPIEKKPLHHFLPGSAVYSAGFVGCNMRCPFCQNWEISQRTEEARERVSPRELVEAALASGSPSLAYTYSEPSVHFEYLIDAMRLARQAGLYNVLVTNGCLLEKPARELLTLTDAANVDLKCWSKEAYRSRLGGDLETVLAFIRLAAGLCHLEVTTLVVPGLSDAAADMEGIAKLLASLSPDIPLHLSAYHPAWKEDAAPSSRGDIENLAALAGKSLRYVYIGNVAGSRADTICPRCGAAAIRRRGYATDAGGIVPGRAPRSAACSSCGAPLPIRL
ncbi:MAG: AmmeMemoRadiSam system radical SAM enzyme, partial [Treponema sp.]|nr:AmmeMemoRadiSam system radical SAM enzyme [Treponema sp.]